MRAWIVISTLFLALGWSSTASAQYWANDDRPELIISSTTTTSAVVVGSIMLTVVNVKKEPKTALRVYLEQNESAVRATLSLGAGPALDDLAAMFGVTGSDLRPFARLLRAERDVLAGWAWPEPNADRFARHVRTAMRFDPRLRELL